MTEKENSCLGHYPRSRVQISEEDLAQFKFETTTDSDRNVHLDENELRKYVSLKLSVSEKLIEDIIDTELEYMRRCGIVTE